MILLMDDLGEPKIFLVSARANKPVNFLKERNFEDLGFWYEIPEPDFDWDG